MLKNYFPLVFVILFIFGNNYAQTYVPDPNFEQALIDSGIDTDGIINQSIPTDVIFQIENLNLSNKNISDLTGIQDFISLKYLNCRNNQLTYLDLGANIALEELYCENNLLYTLYTSSEALVFLACDYNQLSALDLSANTALQYLYCSNNLLTDLDLSTNNSLFHLACDYNQIGLLELSKSLRYLSCVNNHLSTLDLTANTALTELNCFSNQLTNLDLSQNSTLTGLNCSSNLITSLDLSQTAVTSLSCSDNQLTSLNVRNGNNSLTTNFNATNNPSLTCIQIDNKTDADEGVWPYSNWQKDATASYHEDCNGSYISIPDDNFEQALIDMGYDDILDDYVFSSDISQVTSLNVFDRNIADLTGIEGFISLTELICANNDLTSLDLSQNIDLTDLHCYSNQLTSLDVSQNTALTLLYCGANQLSSLDLSQNTALTELICWSNQLSSLNVRNGNNTLINVFKAEGNPLLTCIQVDNETDANASLPPYNNWQKDVAAMYSEDCLSFETTYIPDDNFEQALIDLGIDSDGTINQQILRSDAEAVTTLDVSDPVNNVNLPNVTAKIADLTGIESFINITELKCSKNQLAGLDVSQNTLLIKLFCDNNLLTSLDISSNTAVDLLWCQHNQINSLDVLSNTQLKYLICNNNEIPSLDLSNNALLYSLKCGSNLIEEIDISHNPELEWLWCSYLNLSGGIDISTNLLLRTFVCYNSQLTNLDLSKNTKLIDLDCWSNQLTSLDLSQNPLLSGLRCYDNLLTSLDLRNGSNTTIGLFDASNNSLLCINVDDETADHTSWIADQDVIYSNECSYNTQVGNEVIVTLSQDYPTTVQYKKVIQSGNTTLEIGVVGPEIPDDFVFGDPVNYYNIETTASFTGAIEVAIYFGDMTYVQEDELRIMHYETDHWVDVTTSVDLAGKTIYGEVYSLSPFVVIEYVNTPPIIDNIIATIDPIALGNVVTVTVEYTDDNLREGLIDWGDGIGFVAGDITDQTVVWNYTYPSPGVYAVTVKLIDTADEFVEQTYRYIVVYDPFGGFVTGGGWINSPAGAYIADPLLEGKANFGFTAKYKKGATVPTGNTEFQFKAGDLNFNSSLFDWLVIAGSKAKFKGEGTINGTGFYGFMISAIDEDSKDKTDKFRIKIWDMANEEFVVYDNQIGEEDDSDPTTEIAGGAIVVHSGTKKKADPDKSLTDDLVISEFNVYPNPFSNTAFIDLQFIESKNITIRVYDMYGRFIGSIYDGLIEKGLKYNFEFSTDNSLSSGIYMVRFVIDNERAITKKIMLTR